MLNAIDDFLNRITMYRLLVYYLSGLLGVAFVLGLFGSLGFSPFALLVSTAVLVAACWGINRGFAFVFRTLVNHESSVITALILALLITPHLDTQGIGFLLAAAGLAMASKYLLTINHVHIFNPAALALVLTALGPRQNASWWIGTAVLLPFVLTGGLLMVRKIQREQMVLAFLASTFLATLVFTWLGHGNVISVLKQVALTSPVFFLGFVMLTEPLTSPGTRTKQTWFGVLVGVLLPPQVHLASLYTSPELALVVGNVFAYIIEPRVRLFPVLTHKIRVAANSLDFVFAPGKRLAYQPGQYMEWTLPHDHIDNRGNRRYFTLASSPTESSLRLGVKFYGPASSYKQAMLNMTDTTPIVAAHVAGDFVLPRDPNRKLVFIAGGIGITPFRSMVKYLLDTREERDINLLYAVNDVRDIAYRELFEQARQELSVATTYVVARPEPDQRLGGQLRPGYVDTDTIRTTIPDYRERTFYISGPPQMVAGVRDTLRGLGISHRHIVVDYFPGYV